MASPRALRAPPSGFAAHRTSGGKRLHRPASLHYDPLLALSRLESEFSLKSHLGPALAIDTSQLRSSRTSTKSPHRCTCALKTPTTATTPATSSASDLFSSSPLTPSSCPRSPRSSHRLSQVLASPFVKAHELWSSSQRSTRSSPAKSLLQCQNFPPPSALECSFILFEDSPLPTEKMFSVSLNRLSCNTLPIGVEEEDEDKEYSYLEFEDEVTDTCTISTSDDNSHVSPQRDGRFGMSFRNHSPLRSPLRIIRQQSIR